MKKAVLGASAFLAGCAGPQQSAVNPASPQASDINVLWWVLFYLLGAIFVAVIVVMFLALTRRHRGIEQEPLERIHRPSEETENRLKRPVMAASIATVVILLILIGVSVSTGKAISNFSETKPGITIEVTGNQWWWYVRYLNDDPSRIVVTANEIHVPVGTPIMIRGTSHDVIHSFWAPNMNGKIDLIPSRITTRVFEADRPGSFRGQCAEFCGLQHAHMVFWVIAEPQEQFQAWVKQQLSPAIPPGDPDTTHGQQAFLSYACVLCHSIQGTPAAGQNGPDLTHFGSRITLAAGTLPNTKGNLAGWITDPQMIKPGNHMATIAVKPDDLQPLVDYLESLK